MGAWDHAQNDLRILRSLRLLLWTYKQVLRESCLHSRYLMMNSTSIIALTMSDSVDSPTSLSDFIVFRFGNDKCGQRLHSPNRLTTTAHAVNFVYFICTATMSGLVEDFIVSHTLSSRQWRDRAWINMQYTSFVTPSFHDQGFFKPMLMGV